MNGVKNGKGKEYYLNKENIKIRNEKIKMNKTSDIEFYENGNLRFEGEYKKDIRWSGKGYDNEGKEVFNIMDGKGQGREYNYEGELLYEGDFLEGKRHNGKGVEYSDNGELLYKGDYLDGKKKDMQRYLIQVDY